MARMQSGDELKLTLDPVGQRAYGKPWEGLGQVLRISDSEVSLMMLGGNVPLDVTDGYQVKNGNYVRVSVDAGGLWLSVALRPAARVCCVIYRL